MNNKSILKYNTYQNSYQNSNYVDPKKIEEIFISQYKFIHSNPPYLGINYFSGNIDNSMQDNSLPISYQLYRKF